MAPASHLIKAPCRPPFTVKWRARLGAWIPAGGLLAACVLDGTQVKVFSPVSGKLVERRCSVDDGATNAAEEQGIGRIEEGPCPHTVVVAGLCADCGISATSFSALNSSGSSSGASVSVTHTAASGFLQCGNEVSVSVEAAKELEYQKWQSFLMSRKLPLILDLDNTLLHANPCRPPPDIEAREGFRVAVPTDPDLLVPTPAQGPSSLLESAPNGMPAALRVPHYVENPDEAVLERIRRWESWVIFLEDFLPTASEGRALCSTPETPMSLYTCYLKLRPGVLTFLREAAKRFELYLFTAGTAGHAAACLRVLDPERKWFGNRVFTREDLPQLEGGSFGQKTVERIFPGLSSSLVTVVDDSQNAWMEGSNVVRVHAYQWWPSLELRPAGFRRTRTEAGLDAPEGVSEDVPEGAPVDLDSSRPQKRISRRPSTWCEQLCDGATMSVVDNANRVAHITCSDVDQASDGASPPEASTGDYYQMVQDAPITGATSAANRAPEQANGVGPVEGRVEPEPAFADSNPRRSFVFALSQFTEALGDRKCDLVTAASACAARIRCVSAALRASPDDELLTAVQTLSDALADLLPRRKRKRSGEAASLTQAAVSNLLTMNGVFTGAGGLPQEFTFHQDMEGWKFVRIGNETDQQLFWLSIILGRMYCKLFRKVDELQLMSPQGLASVDPSELPTVKSIVEHMRGQPLRGVIFRATGIRDATTPDFSKSEMGRWVTLLGGAFQELAGLSATHLIVGRETDFYVRAQRSKLFSSIVPVAWLEAAIFTFCRFDEADFPVGKNTRFRNFWDALAGSAKANNELKALRQKFWNLGCDDLPEDICPEEEPGSDEPPQPVEDLENALLEGM